MSPSEAKALHHGLIEAQSHEEIAQALGVTVRQSKYLRKKIASRAQANTQLASLAEELLRP